MENMYFTNRTVCFVCAVGILHTQWLREGSEFRSWISAGTNVAPRSTTHFSQTAAVQTQHAECVGILQIPVS